MQEEERNDSDEDLGSSENEASKKKLTTLLNIAVACIVVDVEKQSSMWEVL